MNARTETAPTAHGDVEYEVVTCCSCDNDVAKEDAKRVVAGDVWGNREYTSLGKAKYDFSVANHTEGWVCPFCYDGGVDSFAGFPTPDAPAMITDPVISTLAWGLFMLIVGFLVGVPI